MIAEPPLEAGATHDKRTWPDTFVGAAVNERGADGTVRGMALATLLEGPLPAALRASTRK